MQSKKLAKDNQKNERMLPAGWPDEFFGKKLPKM
jgi:hypothetical protein